MLVASAAALGYVKTRTANYQSTEQLQLSSGAASNAAQVGLPVSTTSPAVLGTVSGLLHVSASAATGIAGEVSFIFDPTTGLVNVTASDASAALAQRYANAFAEAYVAALHAQTTSQIASLQQQSRALLSQISSLSSPGKQAASVSVTAQLDADTASYTALESQIVNTEIAPPPASVFTVASPATKSLTSKKKIIVIAVVVGLLVGIGLALVRIRFDKRLRTGGDVGVDVPLLAELPFERSLDPRRYAVPVVDDPSSIFADRVRELRTTLTSALAAMTGAEGAVVLVTSPEPGDGKSFLTANLAASCALSGRNTVAVSTDLRRPRLDTLLGVPTSVTGLSTLTTVPLNGAKPAPVGASINAKAPVSGVADPEHRGVLGVRPDVESVRGALVATRVPGLWLLPTGPAVSVDPGDLLASAAMREVIQQLRSNFDYVFIDTPAVESVADAGALARLADGVIVVARANRTSRTVLRGTVARLTSAGATISGVVMNLTTLPRTSSTGYYLAERGALPETTGSLPES